MSGASTTVDSRAALRAEISRRYGRNIGVADWSGVKPSDAPPSGLGSQDADDWQITLANASNRMAQSYSMASISLEEAGNERTVVLDNSVALLVAKASTTSRLRLGKPPLHPLDLIAGVGLAVGLAAILTATIASVRKSNR